MSTEHIIKVCLFAFYRKFVINNFQGFITEISVIDIKTAREDWFFKTDALIKEELRNIEADKQFLQVDGAEIDLQEASFAITMRRIQQRDTEELMQRKVAFEARLKTSEIEIDEHTLDTKVDLRKESIDDQAEQERLQREKAKLLRERDFDRERAKGDHEDQQTEAEHEMGLEKLVAKHDVELGDLTGEAQSRAKRRDISDDVFKEEESIRLEAKKKEQLGQIEEDLQDRQNQRQLDKLAKMAELEANMAKQDMDFELQKTESMKGMTAQEILAMQAAQLVKSGGASAAADIVNAIAESQADAAGSTIKDDLYKQMLNIQKESSQQSIDAYKNSVDAALQSSDNMAKVASVASTQSSEGYKEAAKIAQSTNEKSMESMAKVATASANRKTGKDDNETATETPCKNVDCDFVFEGKVKKFCTKCGTNQLIN